MITFQEWNVRQKVGEAGLRVTANMCLIDDVFTETAHQRRLIKLDKMNLPSGVKRVASRIMWETRTFSFDDAGMKPTPIEESSTYMRMADIWEHRENLDQSQTYEEIRRALEKNGCFRHKKYEITDVANILDLLEACYLELIVSIGRDGYLPDKKNDFSTNGIGTAYIGHNNRLISGPAATHRKVAAKIIGYNGVFPLRIIGIHQDWLTANGIRRSNALHKLPAIFETVAGVSQNQSKT